MVREKIMFENIVMASAIVILVVSLYLAMSKNYDDGVIGHAALGGMALASAAPLYEAIVGVDYSFVPTTALMYLAVAVFMTRHAFRFTRWRLYGTGTWRHNNGNEIEPKQGRRAH